jgi:hypothetical protein
MREPTWIRFVLGPLLAFLALNAFGGGYYAMSGADGVPTAWLAGSLFHDYLVPGLVLFFVVGGAAGVAAVALLTGLRIARAAAALAGAIVLAWLVVQVSIIGYVSWLQPVTALGGVLVLLLAWRLPATRTESA